MHEAREKFSKDVPYGGDHTYKLVAYECTPCEQVIYSSPYKAGNGGYEEIILPLPYTYYFVIQYPGSFPVRYLTMVGIAPSAVGSVQEIKTIPLPNNDDGDICFLSGANETDHIVHDYWRSGFNHDLDIGDELRYFLRRPRQHDVQKLLHHWSKLSFEDLPGLDWTALAPLSEYLLKTLSEEKIEAADD